jgi:eukaryotic-like serine/threonine-protein kinase
MQSAAGPPSARLNDLVVRYEEAQERDGHADLADFLPPPGHPLYLLVLRELVRLEMEYGWQRGQLQMLDAYEKRFPELFLDPVSLQEVAFEDYRLRCQAGERPSPTVYRIRYGVTTFGWPVPAECPTDEKALSPSERLPAPPFWPEARAADSGWASASASANAKSLPGFPRCDPQRAGIAREPDFLPRVGERFLDFRLIAELGRGTFGRVYLAEQGDLAGRAVALKVAPDLFGESQTLAQLQHTNIVPVYSLHRSPPLQAVCMPYFGPTTLADIVREVRGRATLPSSGKELVSSLAAIRDSSLRVGYPASSEKTRQTASDSPRVGCHARPGQTRQAASDGSTVPNAAAPPTKGVSSRAIMPTPSPGQELPRARLARLTYVQAVLWLGARLAEGLAHAHERGILHLDLKPANILLTDEGQPMLLDFNLSQDGTGRPLAGVGGTLPYMAPEHLEAFAGKNRRLDGRCDIFGLGVLLHELLTGKHPFEVPSGRFEDVVPLVLASRRSPPPALRQANPAVSPAVESIIRHCLELDPDHRYPNARALQQDLELHLQDRPLRHAAEPSWRERTQKWLRRNPRLASGAALLSLSAVVLLVLLTTLASRDRRLKTYEARAGFRDFESSVPVAQFHALDSRTSDRSRIEEGLSRCRALLSRYQVLDDPHWRETPQVLALPVADRQRLASDAGDLLLLCARLKALNAGDDPGGRTRALEQALEFNRKAEECFPSGDVPDVVSRQRISLLEALGRVPSLAIRPIHHQTGQATARNLCLEAAELSARGRYAEALSRLEQATRRDPHSFWAWLDRGLCHEHLGRYDEAAACYSTCLALNSSLGRLYFKRGLAYLQQKKYREAEADFSEMLHRQPGFLEALVNRALARMGQQKVREAEDDLSRVLKQPVPCTRVWFIRARACMLLGDQDGARRDWAEGLQRRPSDEQSWLARAVARLERDPHGALADIEAALVCNPRSLQALQNKAHVLAEKLGRTEEAIRALDRLVALYPDHVHGRASRGVLLARLGKRTEALADARECLEQSDRPETQYQVAGIYALTSRQKEEDRRTALRLLARAFRAGYGLDLFARDHDLDPIRHDPPFRRLVAAMQQLP